MGAKVTLLCLFAVAVLHCCAAKEEREDSKTQWKSIEEIVSEIPKKILIGCGEQAVHSVVSHICTDLESDRCQRVVRNAWDAYHYYGLATGTYSWMENSCTKLGDWLYQGVKVAAEISWYGAKSTAYLIGCTLYYAGYGLTSGAKYLLEWSVHTR